MPEALIFDFDGLILDTEVPVYEVWQETYRAHGHELPIETYVGCVGSDFAEFNPRQHLDSLTKGAVDWNHWDSWRAKTATEHTHRLDPFPGVVSLLEEATSAGVPCVIASSSPRSWVEGHLERLVLMPHFAGTRCLDDVASPKPDPELFLAAAAVVGVETHRALVLEDSLNGLKASLAARIDCVIIPNRITVHLDFPGATAVLPTLENVTLAHLVEIKSTSS